MTKKERFRAWLPIAEKWVGRASIAIYLIFACFIAYYGIRTFASGGTFASFLNALDDGLGTFNYFALILAVKAILSAARGLTNEE